MERPSMLQIREVDIPHEIDIPCSMMNKILYHALERNKRKQISNETICFTFYSITTARRIQ
jgi:hypothetical protein